MRTATTSLKSGNTAELRKILNAIDTVTAAPTAGSIKYLLNGADTARLLFNVVNSDVNNAVTFYIQMWLFNEMSGIWHRADRIAVTGNDTRDISVTGMQSIQFEVDLISFSGAGLPTLDMWAGRVVRSGDYRD